MKTGQFYIIYQLSDNFVIEDKTKCGLEVRERYFETKYNAECDSGTTYDAGGTGYKVGIRWFFPQSTFKLDEVVGFAEEIKKRYLTIREMICPDD